MILKAYVKLGESYNGTVIIDSEDTDVYVQAAYVAHDLPSHFSLKARTLCLSILILSQVISQIC